MQRRRGVVIGPEAPSSFEGASEGLLGVKGGCAASETSLRPSFLLAISARPPLLRL
jgi:hypothetical protein